ncbi:MAG: DNA polymerase III subunit delta' [Gemmataceae bacterium]|nr:DNA polymerase III subunit delta' [Gemmataceae bacterium]
MSWSHIHGHERWVEWFRQVVSRGRLAHAYLFVGPAGVGKHRFALELAKALLCERNDPGQLDACGQCESCVLVQAGTHPDFFRIGKPWIDPTDNEEKNVLPIALMRELCASFGLKSARGRGKVAVLDDADDLHDEPANCFLKTLEEPPPRSVLILIGTSLEGQLPTIRSRCQVIRFAPLREDKLGAILSQHELADPSLAARLVKLAAGSPGQALDLADPQLWEFRNRLLQGFGQPKIDTVGLAKSFIEFVEDAGKEAVAQRRRAALVLKLLIQGWSDALYVQLAGPAASAPAAETALVQPLAQRTRPDQILRVLQRCVETEAHLDRYVQVGLVVEALVDALGQIVESPAGTS